MKKKILRGGFIGGHLGEILKERYYVRICDIKKHAYFEHSEICDEFIVENLTDSSIVKLIIEEVISI